MTSTTAAASPGPGEGAPPAGEAVDHLIDKLLAGAPLSRAEAVLAGGICASYQRTRAGVLAGMLTRLALAEQLGVSVDTLQRWETQRVGPPCVRVGKRVLYPEDRARAWLARQVDSKEAAFVRDGKPAPAGRVSEGSRPRHRRGRRQ
jgi:hypothetical protein